MCADEQSRAELLRLVRSLRRARRTFTDVAQELDPCALEQAIGPSGWTVRRLIEYCHANERWHMSRMYNVFEPDVKVYDKPAASLDHEAPETRERTLARECAEIWLAGRETEMWIDLIEQEDIDSVRRATAHWPQGGWTIREIFARVTALYREKARALKEAGLQR